MTGEDFAFITEALPAAYMHLGIGNETLSTTSELHTPTFRIDESVGASIVWIALSYDSDAGSPGAHTCIVITMGRALHDVCSVQALHIGAAFHASLALEYLRQYSAKTARAHSEL
jgi:hypothetical protein